MKANILQSYIVSSIPIYRLVNLLHVTEISKFCFIYFQLFSRVYIYFYFLCRNKVVWILNQITWDKISLFFECYGTEWRIVYFASYFHSSHKAQRARPSRTAFFGWSIFRWNFDVRMSKQISNDIRRFFFLFLFLFFFFS